MIGVDDDHGHTSQAKQSPVELSDSDPMTKQLGKEFWELQVGNQLAFTNNSEELLEGEESESAPGIVDVTTESSDMNTEENVVEENSSEPEELESITHGNKEPFEASMNLLILVVKMHVGLWLRYHLLLQFVVRTSSALKRWELYVIALQMTLTLLVLLFFLLKWPFRWYLLKKQ
jgi:hypothetical protein